MTKTHSPLQFALLTMLLLVALTLRLHRLDDVPYDYDRSRTHGMGIALFDSLSDGTFGQYALSGQPSSIGLPNPVLANYILALISIFDRSPFVATALIAIASVLTVAVSYDIGRRTAGAMAGLFAAALAASSPWAVYFARGAWQLSMFELGMVVPAWLIWRGVTCQSRWQALSGILAAAVTMHIYIVGFGLILQVVVQSALIMLRHPKWRATCAVGLIVCALSLASYIAVLLNADPQFFSHPSIRLGYGVAGRETGLSSPLPVNLLAIRRALDLVGGSEFEEILITDAEQVSAVRAVLLDTRALLVGAAMLLGMVVCATRWFRHVPTRLLLAWFWTPVLAMTVLTSLSRATPVSYYYMPLTDPAGFVCGGIGLALIAQVIKSRLARVAPNPAYTNTTLRARAIWVIGIVFLLGPATGSAEALAAEYAAAKQPSTVLALPMREQLTLSRNWAQACHELSVPFNPFENRMNLEYWAISVAGSKSRVHPAAESYLGTSQAWATRADGGTCSIRVLTAPAPPGAIVLPLPSSAGVHAGLYRSLPATWDTPLAETNIGWTLVHADVPDKLRPGEQAPLSFAWRIERLPAEPFAHWRYDVFAKLIDANDTTLAQADAPSIPGASWRVSDEVVQTLALAVPDLGTTKGPYTVEVSLFDRQQGRNAVFASSSRLGRDGVALVFAIRYEP